MTEPNHPLIGPWSHSRVTACSLALLKEKVLRAPPEPRPERLIAIDRRNFGSVLHLGADEHLQSLVDGNGWLDSGELARKLLLSEGGRYSHLAPLVSEIERRMTLYANSFLMEPGKDMTMEERDSIIRNTMLGHELRLAIDGGGNICSFDDCPEDGWRGIVDYVGGDENGQLTVIDGKNRPAIHKKPELLVHEQLSGYVDLVLRKYPGMFKPPYRVGIYYFEFGYTQIVELEHEQMEANVARMHAMAQHKTSLTMENIVPEPGFGKCQYCDYLASCPAGQELMEGGELVAMDEEQARRLASQLMVWSEKVSNAKKALNAYCAEHGPVQIDDDTSIGHSLSLDGIVYDTKLALRVLKKMINDGEIDGELSQFTSLNLDAVKKVAKKKAVGEALKAAASPKIDAKFEFFRASKKKGVRMVKKGRGKTPHPDDLDFADGPQPSRATTARVKAGQKKRS